MISDRATIMPRTVDVSSYISAFDVSPDGKRAVIEARGELFSVPAEQGYVLNLTATSGALKGAPARRPTGNILPTGATSRERMKCISVKRTPPHPGNLTHG